MVLTLTTELVDTVKMCKKIKRLAGHYIRSQPLVNGEKYWQCTYKKSCFTLVVITDIPVNEVTEKRIAGGNGARGRGTKEKRVADRLCHLCKITNSHVFLSFEVFSKDLLELPDSARKNDHALRTPRSRQG